MFILDDADAPATVVQNALLKTLEEPTPSSQFILVTARPDGLLPTVRSRCPMLRFGRLPWTTSALLLTRQARPAARRARPRLPPTAARAARSSTRRPKGESVGRWWSA